MTPVRRPRDTVTPFLRGRVWWARVPRLDAEPVQRSLGVIGPENADVARRVADFLRWLKDRRESWLLDQIASGKVPVGPVYTAHLDNRLPAFITELRDGITDVDLEPFVAKWLNEMERQKNPNARTRATYVRQVRSFIPESRSFRRSTFTKQAIREWLGSLTISQPNRYRAALSSFANFLVFMDVLPVNIVQQVPQQSESAPRSLHLTQEEARRLVDALPAPHKALHALMLATGMEVSAALKLRRQDVGVRQAYAAGTKQASRARMVGVYHRWEWAWEIFVLGAPTLGAAEPVFPGVTYDATHRSLKRALAIAGLPAEYSTHDHRHTWAVQAIRDRIPLPMIASNLGHRDSTMLLKVYGKYIPTGADFAAIQSSDFPRIGS